MLVKYLSVSDWLKNLQLGTFEKIWKSLQLPSIVEISTEKGTAVARYLTAVSTELEKMAGDCTRYAREKISKVLPEDMYLARIPKDPFTSVKEQAKF